MAKVDGGCEQRAGNEMKLTRSAAEELLFHESELLDSWKLREWAGLFTDDGVYLVPPLNCPDGEPAKDLFLIYDDRHRLEQRALRLLKTTAHAESPRSRTRRLISNVRVLQSEDDVVHVTANFVVYRSRFDTLDCFPGHAKYQVVADAGHQFAFRSKTVVLDLDTLRPHGKLSIIL
jgi:p-cumate 2,3-dioxygenase subunit beta